MIPYLACGCGGRAEIDPKNPHDAVQCETCGRKFPPWYEESEAALTNAGYVYTERHGWRTEEDEQGDAPNCEGKCCHPGVERRGRWE